MPPFLIYPGQNLVNTDNNGFPQAFNWVQPAGWADKDGFYQWCICFDRWLDEIEAVQPVILTLDNHVSHL
jgi:hypothetical protein